jgi:hypothetical protein
MLLTGCCWLQGNRPRSANSLPGPFHFKNPGSLRAAGLPAAGRSDGSVAPDSSEHPFVCVASPWVLSGIYDKGGADKSDAPDAPDRSALRHSSSPNEPGVL